METRKNGFEWSFIGFALSFLYAPKKCHIYTNKQQQWTLRHIHTHSKVRLLSPMITWHSNFRHTVQATCYTLRFLTLSFTNIRRQNRWFLNLLISACETSTIISVQYIYSRFVSPLHFSIPLYTAFYLLSTFLVLVFLLSDITQSADQNRQLKIPLKYIVWTQFALNIWFRLIRSITKNKFIENSMKNGIVWCSQFNLNICDILKRKCNSFGLCLNCWHFVRSKSVKNAVDECKTCVQSFCTRSLFFKLYNSWKLTHWNARCNWKVQQCLTILLLCELIICS